MKFVHVLMFFILVHSTHLSLICCLPPMTEEVCQFEIFFERICRYQLSALNSVNHHLSPLFLCCHFPAILPAPLQLGIVQYYPKMIAA